jgi:osmotically-inducible protein OsmY
VFEYWEVQAMERVARKIPGVKRVVDDLELKGGAAED